MKILCGFSQTNITPGAGESFIDGFGFRTTASQGVQDEIMAKVCALSWGEERFAIISVDVCGFNRDTSKLIKEHISHLTGLDASQIALCSTHSHSSPVFGVLYKMPINMVYCEHAAYLIATAVKWAFDHAVCGSFSFGLGNELYYIYNRQGREDIDRNVHVGGFYDENGVLKGVLASASCHPTTRTGKVSDNYGKLYSADYPGVMTQAMSTYYPDVPVLFLQGRGADTNALHRNEWPNNYICSRLGLELSDSIRGVLESKSGGDGVEYTPAYAYDRPRTPRMALESVEKMQAKLDGYMNEYHQSSEVGKHYGYSFEMLWLRRMIDWKKQGVDENLDVPFQVLKLSDKIIFVFFPYELLASTGNDVEAALLARGYDPASTFVIGYSNEVTSYLAPAKYFHQKTYDIGGVPNSGAVAYGYSECSAETEPKSIETMLKMVDSL